MPTQIKYPGLYVEDHLTTAHPIIGVPTSVAAFVGSATKGALKKPALVRSLAEFEEKFGGLRSDLELGYAVRQFFQNGGTGAWIVRASRSLTPATVSEAIKSLDAAASFNLLALPGICEAKIIECVATYCARSGVFLLVDPPATARSVFAMQQFMAAGALPKSRDAAVYFPRLVIRDPLNGESRPTAPSGAVAGMLARCDTSRGIWRAPAGSEATLQSVEALECALTEAEVTALTGAAVNCLRVFPGRPPIAWSARTLASNERNEPEWKYVPIRRLVIYIEQSVSEGTRWAVFEPNDAPLWQRVRGSVETFLLTLWRQQAFAGARPEHAFFVRCGREQTMTASDIANGLLNIEIGFAPVRPAEFVIVKIQHRMTAP